MGQVAKAHGLIDVADCAVLTEKLVEARQRRSVAASGLPCLLGVLLGEKLSDRPLLHYALRSNDLLKEQLMVVVHLRPAPPSWCLHGGKPTPSRELPARQNLRFD